MWIISCQKRLMGQQKRAISAWPTQKCNEYKGDTITALDPLTGEITPLFNPRRQQWDEHFAWTPEGNEVVGLTPIGRATVKALNLNRERLVRARRRWVRV